MYMGREEIPVNEAVRLSVRDAFAALPAGWLSGVQ